MRLFTALLVLAGPASAAGPEFMPVARHNAHTAVFCPDAEDGQICKMSHRDAERYCKDIIAELPTTRDFGRLAQANGSKGLLEVADVKKLPGGVPPPGYYLVDSHDGDTFYFNNEGYRAPEGLLGTESFWTASIVTNKTEYAHVYYGKLGGGGGTPEEHKRSHPHAVVCIRRDLLQ
ncbi:MAG: hypothetical protein HY078_11590 [Elusimicrobia bacterium]|nr:hypothetical protein [Elusimicrobiota bacterium]